VFLPDLASFDLTKICWFEGNTQSIVAFSSTVGRD
jgi:hypothetical protein